jgi:hypothetical protein
MIKIQFIVFLENICKNNLEFGHMHLNKTYFYNFEMKDF